MREIYSYNSLLIDPVDYDTALKHKYSAGKYFIACSHIEAIDGLVRSIDDGYEFTIEEMHGLQVNYFYFDYVGEPDRKQFLAAAEVVLNEMDLESFPAMTWEMQRLHLELDEQLSASETYIRFDDSLNE